MELVTDRYFEGAHLEFRYTKGNAHIYHTMQFHPFCELYFFLNGSAEYINSHGRHRLMPNQLVMIPPGNYHYFHVEEANLSSYERCILNVYPEFPLYDELLRAVNGREILRFSASDRMVQHFRYLQGGTFVMEPKDLDTVLSAVATEILYLIKYADAESVFVSEDVPSVSGALMDYIDAHYKEPINLSDLSARFNYSVSYLSHLFKKKYGIGIKNYILQKRLNAVHSGILCGEKIREAARAYGFEDYPAFFRLYKKSFGTAPSESKKPR